MLRDTACGFGVLGLAGLLSEADRLAAATAKANPLSVRKPHFEPRAKQVIFLFMHGGPSSVDILDPKPRLYRDHGKPLPIKRPLAFEGERRSSGAADETTLGISSGRDRAGFP